MDKFEIYIKDEFEDKKVNKFFRKIMNNFAKESLSTYKEWNEFPFIYSERPLNSVLVPAIHQYTNNIFLEQPFKKKKGKKQRYLDILTSKNNNTYFIELKHDRRTTRKKIRSKADTKWKDAIVQISDLNKKFVKKIFHIKGNDAYYKVALLIMFTSVNRNSKHKILDFSAQEYSEYISGFSQEYNKPNIIGIIKFNDFEKNHDEEKKYPFVSFLIKIEKI